MPENQKDSKKGVCFYHLCRKRTLVRKCSYCGEFFCEKHLRASPPGPPHFTETSEEDRLFMEEWHKEGGHPCVPYLEVFKEERRKQDLEVERALDRLKERRVVPSPPPIDYSTRKQQFVDKSKQTRRRFQIIAIVIFISLIGFFLWGLINARMGPNCIDETSHGQCSNTRPLYCFNGTLTNRADLCGCPQNFFVREEFCEEFGKCNDNTSNSSCSQNQPLYCLNGVLTEKAEVCGCPVGLIENGTHCIEPPRCEDGTLYATCSADKPLFCSEGTLIQKASRCGCPLDYTSAGESCVSRYETSPKEISLEYTLRGQKGGIDYTVYGGLNNYLASKIRPYSELSYLDEPQQKEHLIPLVWAIEHETDNTDDQARIAINLVQSIPYDWEGFRSGDLTGRYPYEVLYDQKGVCGEKAKLLAFLLRELDFGVVLLDYGREQHEAVGIKCPVQYSWENSGYCFVESTRQIIVTDDQAEYVGAGELHSEPNVIFVSEGNSFDSVSEEYSDARDFIRIRDELEGGYQYQDWVDYSTYMSLVEKYGMELDAEQ